MVDDQQTDTTPLVGRAPSPTTQSVSTYKWYHYVIFVLFALDVLAVFVYSFSSLWACIFMNGTIILLGQFFLTFIYPRKPDVVPQPFLVSHLAFGFFLSPLFFFLLIVLIMLVLGITDAIITGIISAIFFAFYPEAARVFADDVAVFSDSASDPRVFTSNAIDTTSLTHGARFVAKSIPHLPGTIYRAIVHARYSIRAEDHKQTATQAKQIFLRIWADMTEAGANPIAMGITIALIVLIAFTLFVLIGGVLVTGALEFVKWRLFNRYRKMPGSQSPSTDLGVKGLIFIAMTGSFAFIFASTFNGALGISGSFYSTIIFTCTYFLDAAIILGTQLFVATTFAEKEILGKDVVMKNAFRTSIKYNFLLGFLRVTPPMAHGPEFSTPILLFIVLTGIRAYFTYRMCKSFNAKFEAVCSEHEETP